MAASWLAAGFSSIGGHLGAFDAVVGVAADPSYNVQYVAAADDPFVAFAACAVAL